MDLSGPATCNQVPQTVAAENHERVRAYEIAAYLAAASFPFEIPDGPPLNPVPSSDLTLNALVQHGAHMMECDRAFLSLIDNRSQFICAEMTREQSLVRQNSERPLLLGAARIPLEWGVCPYTMSIFHGKMDVIPQTPYIVAEPSYFYIRDFREVPSFAERPYVVGYPKMVSYIEVPLRSLSGHIIGSYCVVDDRRRDFLLPASLETIREVAAAVSSYLDLKRVEVSRTRSVRMMDGLNQFIASEKPVLSSDHDTAEARSDPAGPFDLNVFRRSSSAGLDHNAKLEQALQVSTGSTTSRIRTADRDRRPTYSRSNSMPDPAASMNDSGGPSNATNPQLKNVSESSTSNPSSQTSDLFQRAAETIGYALDVDGLVFFDAARASALHPGHRLSSSSKAGGFPETMTHERGMAADILSEYRSDGRTETQLIKKPSQSTILQLIARYPQGHVYVADEYGVMDYEADHDIDAVQNTTHSPAPSHDQKEILECVPKARYAIFLPLWHYQRESCFATCLAWVSETAKTLDSGDVNSLTAFGNSLMVEILRQESSTNVQSKSDFISSISHELRSPLHGIVATTELMQETVKDPNLLSMMEMIESCSYTLLDTFDHLLEFAKINGRTRNLQLEPSNQRHDGASRPERAAVDLAALLEDLLEVVSLGHSHTMQIHSGLKEEQQRGFFGRDSLEPLNSVLVTTFIEGHCNWNLPLDSGAWKRIILNLFSNALKYTVSGFIDVRLGMSEEPDGSSRHITLSVTDTGIGMSEQFLKYHIFTAFMQENNLSPGTGLGLSLVKSIVDSLGGNISVDSRQGEGTCITITVPVDGGTRKPNLQETSNTRNALQGLSLGLFSISSPQTKSAVNAASIASPSKALRNSVRNVCQGKLGMVVLESLAITKTDIVMLDMHTIPSKSQTDWERFLSEALPRDLPPLIVLGPIVKELEQLAGMKKITYINSPITGKKLRAALFAAQKIGLASLTPESEGLSRDLEKLSFQDPSLNVIPRATPKKDQNLLSRNPSSGELRKQSRPILSRNVSTSTITTRFKRFLLVDDNPINLKLLAAFITRVGRPFSTASDGAEAVQLYRDAALEGEPFDCIFMDISMPIMDGFQAIVAIRQFEKQPANTENHISGGASGRPAPRSYILALTGLGSEKARSTARGSGVDVFLLKPVKFRDIVPLLQSEPK